MVMYFVKLGKNCSKIVVLNDVNFWYRVYRPHFQVKKSLGDDLWHFSSLYRRVKEFNTLKNFLVAKKEDVYCWSNYH